MLSFDKDAPLKLALGTTQIREAIHKQPNDSLLLVLQHHSLDWLSDGLALKGYLSNRQHILFCGHTHNETGEINYPFHTGGSILFTAGAGYSQGDYSERYSYSWGQIFSNHIRYYPRIWEERRKTFDADRNKYPDLDQNGSLFIPSSKLPTPLHKWLDKLSPFHNPVFIEGEVTEWIPVFSGELGVLWIQIKCDDAALKNGYKHIAKQVSARLQEVTKDKSIKVLVLTEGSVNVILKGTQEGFKKIIELFSEGKLSDLLSIPVIDVKTHIQGHIHGATLKTSSIPSPIDIIPDTQRDNLMIFPSEPYHPPVLKAVKVFVEDSFHEDFIIDNGDAGDISSAQVKRFADYFCDGLSLKADDIWVNLSAYESKRMIPDSLAKTKLGRDLLAQDCILKRLTASLIHPDSEWGKRYWNKVYEETERVYGDIPSTFNLYQKVWIVPDKAEIYETKLPCENFDKSSPLIKSLCENPDKKEGYVGIIAESRLKVLCETDYMAITKDFGGNENFQDIKSFNDLCTSIFKEVILPVIEEEVNHGQNFILERQIYNALILALLCKEKLQDYHGWKEFIDTGQKSLKPSVHKIEPIEDETIQKRSKPPLSSEDYFKIEERLLPDFDPTQKNINDYFYNQYLDLFKKGLYTCTRRYLNPKTQKIFTQTHFSGGIRFSEMA